MRTFFEKALAAAHKEDPNFTKASEDPVQSILRAVKYMAGDVGIFMSYWYGGLYVVIEGWQELGLRDPTIDSLLASSNVSLLKRFRNGVFHFQREYFDARFSEILQSSDSVPWVSELSSAFGGYFLREAAKAGNEEALKYYTPDGERRSE
jgi:hypothetical protein